MAFRHRTALRAYRHDKDLQSQSILALNPTTLHANGIKIMVLDFDGVLAAHGGKKINPDISQWLSDCIQVFGTGNVFILTNRPSTERADYFAKNFSGVEFIFPTRKKPYPDSILSILQKTQVDPNAE